MNLQVKLKRYTNMRFLIIGLFLLVKCSLNAQCLPIAERLFNSIKTNNYENLEAVLMPIAHQKKIMHWPNDKASHLMLQTLKDSLKLKLITSLKQFRTALVSENFNLKQTQIDSCHLKHHRLKVYVSNQHKKSSFFVETIASDRNYVALPINQNGQTLSYPQPFKKEIQNSVILTDGETFTPISISEEQKKQGRLLLNSCLNKNTSYNNIVLLESLSL